MKRIKRTSELLWIFGTVFVALGVAICCKADLGVSMIAAPAFVINEALSTLWSAASVGVVEYIFQGVLLLVLFLLLRRFRVRFLFAFLAAVVYGYVLNFFLWALGGITFSAVWLRWLMLFVGDTFTAFGVACFFRTYLPLQVYELFVAEVAAHFHFSIHKTKWAFDISLLTVSVILAFSLFGDVRAFDFSTIPYNSFHSIGLGTLVTTLINSPIIALMGKLIDRVFDATPLFPRLYAFLRGKENAQRDTVKGE